MMTRYGLFGRSRAVEGFSNRAGTTSLIRIHNPMCRSSAMCVMSFQIFTCTRHLKRQTKQFLSHSEWSHRRIYSYGS